ncbi:MAG TPA: biosynthetic-type acetolactate synthase large subunit [Syntrophorhabdaceae bacterium]|nr:biosynthetic-type acetolactate synthase large subunit [Syntrophorhabdaceae bacterium]
MRLNGAEIIIRALEKHGITVVAGIPGGANLPIYDALYKSRIRHILARHEQGAGFIAQGIARTTGRAAVCFATSGPGATNLVTAIADAKLDSVPLIAITGQVASSMIGTDAFQEVDTFGMTFNITKHSYLVKDVRDLPQIMEEAFHIAEAGRPGPVLIDVPKDVQIAQSDDYCLPSVFNTSDTVEQEGIEQIARMINSSARPLIYAGGGIIHSDGAKSLYELAKKNSIPVALSLMGLGTFPPDDPLYLGMLGMHGAPCTNYILDEIDLLLALGARFDDRATGRMKDFCPQATVIHVDIDVSEIDKIRKSTYSLRADIREALTHMIPLVESNDRDQWTTRIKEIKAGHPLPIPSDGGPLNPLNLIRKISRIAADNTIITTDVGQHQMWVAQNYSFRSPRTFLTSGGLGTMGFGLPAAIGAALANPDKKVICISGDGSIQMNIQEFATLGELGLDVLVLIMNNQHLGLVRQQQELFFGGNFIASKFATRLDFAAIGRQFGIRGISLNESLDPMRSIESALKDRGPCIIDIPIYYGENVFPIVPPGAANRDMILNNSHATQTKSRSISLNKPEVVPDKIPIR